MCTPAGALCIKYCKYTIQVDITFWKCIVQLGTKNGNKRQIERAVAIAAAVSFDNNKEEGREKEIKVSTELYDSASKAINIQCFPPLTALSLIFLKNQ